MRVCRWRISQTKTLGNIIKIQVKSMPIFRQDITNSNDILRSQTWQVDQKNSSLIQRFSPWHRLCWLVCGNCPSLAVQQFCFPHWSSFHPEFHHKHLAKAMGKAMAAMGSEHGVQCTSTKWLNLENQTSPIFSVIFSSKFEGHRFSDKPIWPFVSDSSVFTKSWTMQEVSKIHPSWQNSFLPGRRAMKPIELVPSKRYICRFVYNIQ